MYHKGGVRVGSMGSNPWIFEYNSIEPKDFMESHIIKRDRIILTKISAEFWTRELEFLMLPLYNIYVRGFENVLKFLRS